MPPFFPSFVLFARPPKPDEYEHRLAGIRAHNRWLVDFCGRFPERRAGIGQIFLNDIDDAIEDVRWIKEHGLRGGILLPNDPARRRLDQAAQPPRLRPAVGGVRGAGGAGQLPRRHRVAGLRRVPSSALMMHRRGARSTRHRPLVFMMLSGVFERFPSLKFVMTEQGCAWLPAVARPSSTATSRASARTARIGELRFKPEHVLPRSATEYFQQNCGSA